jgi:hypothetical protein
MTNETRDSRHKVYSHALGIGHFIWPLSNSPTLDEMNTSFGPRIDADRWDFHDGIDLPLPLAHRSMRKRWSWYDRNRLQSSVMHQYDRSHVELDCLK